MAALPLQTTWRDTKPLLVQAMPPLDLACLRDGLKNAFIIPQNASATVSGELVVWRLTTDYSRCWTNTRTGVRVHSSEAV